MLNRRQFLIGTAAVSGLRAQQAPRIRQIDIFHHSHLDVGYTETPSVCRDLHTRYLDAAIDLCVADRRFRWTVEALVPLDDWWRAASESRRRTLLKLVEAGQIDVMALPFNQTPFLNARQWDQMLGWIPRELWQAVRPRMAMQSDVNGFPRAGALRLLDRGVRHLIMGINSDSGGPALPKPAAFWWKMPGGQRMFVWQGEHYGRAYDFFEPKQWGRGGHYLETELRLPRTGDYFRTDEASLRAAHEHLLKALAKLNRNYSLDRLVLSATNQWRWDNDPPFAALPDFVDAWNGLGLEPRLRLTTGTQAVLDLEASAAAQVPEYAGEWPDWWANGDASGPREVAASRVAKRALAAAESTVWGPMPASAAPSVDAILRDLCLFDEHTWGASDSISRPHGLNPLAQYAEKSLLAYRPMGNAEWLLARRARTRAAQLPEGVHVANTGPAPYTGWVRISERALGGGGRALVDPKSGRQYPVAADQVWMENLPARSLTLFRLEKAAGPAAMAPKPDVQAGSGNWPVAVRWAGMSEPLFAGEFGSFLRVGATDRRDILRVHETGDAALRQKTLRRTTATYGDAQVTETPYTLVYRQAMQHERLGRSERVLELWKGTPQARLTVRLERLSSTAPEVLYLGFELPQGCGLPVLSSGGLEFAPYRDQLPGACRDYFGFDGWAHYQAPAGHWLWVSRDAPLVSVGGPHTLERRSAEAPDPHRLFAMVFDNCWHTNFVADSHGVMEFQFDLAWYKELPAPAEAAETLVSNPVVLVNDGTRDAPAILNNLFRP